MSLKVITTQSQPTESATEGMSNHCIAVKEIMLWQAERYRAAVSDNRWFMSQKLNRYVAWYEAELDFCENNTYGCAEKWRLEYCGKQCAKRGTCALASLFLDRDHPVAA